MKLPVVALILLAACGSSATDTGPTRYNFGIVDGANQVSTAGDAALAKRVTSQLTRDPNGTFATRVFDFLAPTIAYAQGLVLSGTPVAGAIVCGREAKLGEPQIVPLCAFTLSDGKAANAVQPGTKAGKFNILFTAQVPATEPVKDSTTVTVNASAATHAGGGNCSTGQPGCYLVDAGSTFDLHPVLIRAWDQFENLVDLTTKTPGYKITACAPSVNGQTPVCVWPAPVGTLADGAGWTFTIDAKWKGQYVLLYVFLDGNVVVGWPLEVR